MGEFEEKNLTGSRKTLYKIFFTVKEGTRLL